ncbi:hypothetical protein BJQ90_03448 [Arthrobacter sp. SO3]|nr:hypothetical protein [Arthrobacter sp. SO3]
MLKDLDLIAVLPAKGIARASTFCRDVLRLEPADAMDEVNLMYRRGKGTSFLLYKTDNAGTAKNTQMGWGTDNLEAEVEELRGRGVVFEEYDFPGLKTENGIATTPVGKAAWFLGSEGNILNLFQSPERRRCNAPSLHHWGTLQGRRTPHATLGRRRGSRSE